MFCHSSFRPNPGQRTTLIVLSIVPDLARLWWFYASKAIDLDKVKVILVDRCGGLKAQHLPGVTVFSLPNIMHERALDYLIQMVETPYYFACDDDDFLLHPDIEPSAIDIFEKDPQCAAVSFHPRYHGSMGIMCTLFRRSIFLKEKIVFGSYQEFKKQCDPQYRDKIIDAGDQVELMLKLKGYRIQIVESGPPRVDLEMRSDKIALFHSISTAVLVTREMGKTKLMECLCEKRSDWQHYLGWWLGVMGWYHTSRLYQAAFAEKSEEPCPYTQEDLDKILKVREGESYYADMLAWQENIEDIYRILSDRMNAIQGPKASAFASKPLSSRSNGSPL